MLSTKGVKKKYGSRYIIEDVKLELEKGHIYGLLGPNGCGKSTMMKMIAGLVRPTEGMPLFHGEPIGTESKKHIAYMPTEPYFYSFMTPVSAGKYYADFFDDFDENVYSDFLKKMEIPWIQKIKSLSSGQIAKLKIALTMARDADLYMLDEPLNGIDLLARDRVLNAVITRVTSEKTILMSSHLVEEIEPVIDYVIMLGKGRILAEGECETMRMRDKLSVADLYRKTFGGGITC